MTNNGEFYWSSFRAGNRLIETRFGCRINYRMNQCHTTSTSVITITQAVCIACDSGVPVVGFGGFTKPEPLTSKDPTPQGYAAGGRRRCIYDSTLLPNLCSPSKHRYYVNGV